MRVPELLLPPKMSRMFGPKMAIFAPKYAFLGPYGPCRFIWCPVGWLIGGCGAWSVSRTYLLYDINSNHKKIKELLTIREAVTKKWHFLGIFPK